MANLRDKFEVIDKFVMQFRFSGLVIHVVFKSRSLASSKYVGGFCNDLSFLTTRHFFRYARFLPDSKTANQYYSKPGIIGTTGSLGHYLDILLGKPKNGKDFKDFV